MYSLFDKKMSEYGPVLMATNDGHVSRTMLEVLRGSSHTMAMFPEDFDLYQVGIFGSDTGNVVAEHRFVCNMAVVLNGGEPGA